MDRSDRVLRAPRGGLGSAIAGTSPGLSEAMVGVSSTGCELPSFGARRCPYLLLKPRVPPLAVHSKRRSPALVLVDTTLIRITGEPDLIRVVGC